MRIAHIVNDVIRLPRRSLAVPTVAWGEARTAKKKQDVTSA